MPGVKYIACSSYSGEGTYPHTPSGEPHTLFHAGGVGGTIDGEHEIHLGYGMIDMVIYGIPDFTSWDETQQRYTRRRNHGNWNDPGPNSEGINSYTSKWIKEWWDYAHTHVNQYTNINNDSVPKIFAEIHPILKCDKYLKDETNPGKYISAGQQNPPPPTTTGNIAVQPGNADVSPFISPRGVTLEHISAANISSKLWGDGNMKQICKIVDGNNIFDSDNIVRNLQAHAAEHFDIPSDSKQKMLIW